MSDVARPARKRRKRRDPCSAHRSVGQPCQASATPGGTVCRFHGGSAPQVRIKAGLVLRQERYIEAMQGLEEHERGSERCKLGMHEKCRSYVPVPVRVPPA